LDLMTPNDSGLFTLATSCPVGGSGVCSMTEIVDAALPARTNKFNPGLAYSADSHRFYLIGEQVPSRTEYDSFDADALALGNVVKRYTRTIEGFYTGGLAAMSVPEPATDLAAAAALASLAALALRRRRTARRAGERSSSLPAVMQRGSSSIRPPVPAFAPLAGPVHPRHHAGGS
jgi:hypothetical protein